jgi:hypothetical protein
VEALGVVEALDAAQARQADHDLHPGEVVEMSESEFLTADELVEVTGYKHAASQREWLDKNAWHYVLNAAGRPIVGRWYARMRLSGITPTFSGAQPAWRPDFSTLS